MDTSSMFNAVLKDFLSELRAAFPDNEGIHKAKKRIKNVTKISPKLPCNVFKEAMKPYAELIANKDESFVHGDAGNMLKKTLGVDILSIWADASNETKECIWNHINTLYMVSSKEVNVSPDTMNQIQELARQMSSSLDPSDFQNPENMKQTLESLAQKIDTNAIHSIIQQFDPNLANEMLPGLESGELMKGVTDMIQSMDPSLMASMTQMIANPEGADLNKLMSSMMDSFDPTMMMKMMKTLSGENVPRLP